MLKTKRRASKLSEIRQAQPKAVKRATTSSLRKAQALAKARHQRTAKLVKENRPPQSWFDQTDCPFTPAED